jgi:hypothetical protein
MTAPMTSSEPPPSRPGRREAQQRLIGMSRGDALAAVAGLLVFICSFLPQASGSSGGYSYHLHMWHAAGVVEVFAVPLLALAVVTFTVLPIQQTSYADADILGVRPAAWRTVLSLVVAIASVFALFFWGDVTAGGHIAYGAYLVLFFSLATAAGAILPAYVPDLRLPVAPPRAPKPEAPVTETAEGASPVADPPVAAPGSVGWQPPVDPEPADEQPTQGDAIAPAADDVRGPDPTATFEPVADPVAAPADPEPISEPGSEDLSAPASEHPVEPPPAASAPPAAPRPFEPFWACFPTIRPLVDRMNTALTIGQVSPEEWYLVTGLDEHGASVSTSDGRSGLLLDTSGLIRADQ